MHIGKKIREVVKKSELSVTEFAVKINYSRRNVYSIFEKESVDTSLLTKIGAVLSHDFFVYYSSTPKKNTLLQGQVAEPSGVAEYSENRIRELVKEVEYLKEINSMLKSQVEALSKKKSSKK